MFTLLLLGLLSLEIADSSFPLQPVIAPSVRETTDDVCVNLLNDDRVIQTQDPYNNCSFYCIQHEVHIYYYPDGKRCSHEGNPDGVCLDQTCRRSNRKFEKQCSLVIRNANFAKKSDSNNCLIECYRLPNRQMFNVPMPNNSRCFINEDVGTCEDGICKLDDITTEISTTSSEDGLTDSQTSPTSSEDGLTDSQTSPTSFEDPPTTTKNPPKSPVVRSTTTKNPPKSPVVRSTTTAKPSTSSENR